MTARLLQDALLMVDLVTVPTAEVIVALRLIVTHDAPVPRSYFRTVLGHRGFPGSSTLTVIGLIRYLFKRLLLPEWLSVADVLDVPLLQPVAAIWVHTRQALYRYKPPRHVRENPVLGEEQPLATGLPLWRSRRQQWVIVGFRTMWAQLLQKEQVIMIVVRVKLSAQEHPLFEAFLSEVIRELLLLLLLMSDWCWRVSWSAGLLLLLVWLSIVNLGEHVVL